MADRGSRRRSCSGHQARAVPRGAAFPEQAERLAAYRARILELTTQIITHPYWRTLSGPDRVEARTALEHVHDTPPTPTRSHARRHPDPRRHQRPGEEPGLLDWLRRQVGQTEPEIQEAHEQARRERAPAEMAFKIQPQRSSSTALLHRGGCATYPNQVGLISREDALVALAEPASSRARSADPVRTPAPPPIPADRAVVPRPGSPGGSPRATLRRRRSRLEPSGAGSRSRVWTSCSGRSRRSTFCGRSGMRRPVW